MVRIITLAIFVLTFAFCLPFLSRKLSRYPKVLFCFKYVIFAVYIFANLSQTVLFRAVQPTWVNSLTLFSTYRESLEYTASQTIAVTDAKVLKNIILNVILYIPMGYLLPFVWPKLMRVRRVSSVSRITLIGFFFSLATELTQLVFHIGSFEADDIFNNTLGCLIGCVLYWIILRTNGVKE